MIKQLILPLVGVAAFIVIVGLLTQGKINLGSKMPSPTPSQTIKVGNTEVNITIADSEEERKKGLAGVTKLGDNEGMLFVFDSKDVTPSFWMKDMLIPIDIIWINDGKVIKIDKNVPNSDQSKLYTAPEPIDYVLEVAAGFSDKNNLKVGDSAEGDSIKN